MTINIDYLLAQKSLTTKVNYNFKQTILYALSVGMGRSLKNVYEMPFVYEGEGLKVLPSFPTAVFQKDILKLFDGCGWDYTKVLLGETRVAIFHPIPAEENVSVTHHISSIHDKGKDKGILITTETNVFLEKEKPLCRIENLIVARGDGGLSKLTGSNSIPHIIPKRSPDVCFEICTREDQALFYRLLGDLNPLHVDQEVAKLAGFERPILHGLCTFGAACYAIVSTVCQYNTNQIKKFNAKFSLAVYPGEIIITDIWVDYKTISFQCRTKNCNRIVLNNGFCLIE